MRWMLAAALVVLAGAVLVDVQMQRQTAARVEALAVELRASGRARPGGIALGERELEQLAAIVAARVVDGLPAPVAQPASPPPAAATRSEPPAPPSPAQRAAADSAQRVLDEALSLGTLRREHVQQLQQLLARADHQWAMEFRGRIAMAINRDELRIADPAAGMP